MVFVKVLVDFGCVGDMEPVSITWPDGRVFQVDRVLDVRIAPVKSGGSGVRYLCRILSREVPLYFNESTGQWWMDGRK
ncbi:MAG: hypothetical protein M0P55_03565 [Clostridiales bacterium]|nr:hypothetical protein [Clostridiales bacterium]